MQAESDQTQLLRPESEPLLVLPPLRRFNFPLRLLGILVAVGLLALVTYFAATQHPDRSAPEGSELEARMAAVFGQPNGKNDGLVIGDYLIERFYAIDVETGERYVADILKGRITEILSRDQDTDRPTYTLVLNLSNLQRDRALYAAYVNEVAAPAGEDGGDYLGLRSFAGVNDAFTLNYDGTLPDAYAPFRGPAGEDAFSFLLSQRLAEISASSPRLMGMNGFNYLLNSTDHYPTFQAFGINKSVFLAQIVIVDATSNENQAIFFRLLQEYLHQPAR